MSFQNANVLLQEFANRYGNRDRTYRTLNYVRDVSRANTSVRLDPNTFLVAPGKYRKVKLSYFPILCDVEGDCNSQTLCTTGEKVEPNQIMFDVDQCYATKVFSINKNDIRQTDNGAWDFSGVALEIITGALPDARRGLALRWETQLYSMAGVHPDGNYEKRVTLVDPTTGIVNPMGRVNIDREYGDAGFSRPYILGGAEVYNWQEMGSIGGLNAQGQLINRVDTGLAYYDNGLGDQILGGTGGHILSIAPETFKYVYYLENAGIFRTDMARLEDIGLLYSRGTNGFIEGTLVDPVTGIPWDLYINYDKCTHTWSFWLKHTYGLFIMPDVACNGVDVNGIMRWTTCPQVLAPCPTGVTPSLPAAQSTFSWTPGSIYPLAVSSTLIGGVANQQNEPILVTNITELTAVMNDAYGVPGLFTVSGSAIRYTGWTELDGNINGTVTVNFS